MAQDHFYQNPFSETANLPEVSDRVSSSGQHPINPDSDSNGWQIVDFPNVLSVQNLSMQNTSIQDVTGAGSNPTSKLMDNSVSENGRSMLSSEREIELLTLIRDLNECNDVLLQKVSELEEALDRSQTALQAEIDHSQFTDGSSSKNSGSEVQAGRPTDRQIAKLVTELELSNQALQRQQLLSETLQAELTMNQEKLTQLEHECTLLQQKQADQSQSLLQAEASCRDLRARLHRQQRYTLQFKAALEKCLNVSTDAQAQSNGFVSATDVQSVASSVAMPKAQNIQPWVSEGTYQRLDPQLEAMIRSSRQAEPRSERSMPQQSSSAQLQSAVTTKPADPAAEDQLWQDLARVIEAPGAATDTTLDFNSEFEAEDPFGPSPWHTPIAPQANAAPAADSQPKVSQPEVSIEGPGVAQPKASTFSQEAYVPALDTQAGAPSPRVSPLKPQRKIKSLAAVELPSFPRLPKPAQ